MSPLWFVLEAIFWKLWPCLFFLTAHNFANGPHFVALTQLRPTKTGSNICCTFHIYFLNPECIRIPWVLAPKNFPVEFFRASTHGILMHSGFRISLKRGVEIFFDRVLPARSWEMPVERELPAKIGRCWKKLAGRNFDRRAKSSWEKIFNIYKNFLSGGFRSKVKIVTPELFPTPTYFCWQLAFHRHLPTSGRQNRVKNLLYPPFIYIFWILSA